MSGLAPALASAADALDAHADELTRLDALQGDGDLGRTAGLIADALRGAVSEHPADPAALLRACGARVASTAPSSSGTLVATGLLAAAKAASEGEVDVLVGLRAAADAISARGKARAGDRTMLDAVIPAIESLGTNPGDRAAAIAAVDAGIEATRTMTAKFGRARFLSANAAGEPDPGAVMVGVALIAALRGD